MAVAGHGNIVVAGAFEYTYYQYGAYADEEGYLKVYYRSGNSWIERATLHGAAKDHHLGVSVAATDDGSRIAAMAQTMPFNALDEVWIFTWEGSNYQQTHAINNFGQLPDYAPPPDRIALSADGTIVAIGHHYFSDYPVDLYDLGKVEVFRLDSDGTHTQLGATILGTLDDQWLGKSISLNDAGDVLALGGHVQYDWDDESCAQGGYAEVYDYDGTSWNLRGGRILSPTNPSPAVTIGTGIALSGSGDTLCTGGIGVQCYDWVDSAWVARTLLSSCRSNPCSDPLQLGLMLDLSHDGMVLAAVHTDGVNVYSYDDDASGDGFTGWVQVGGSYTGTLSGQKQASVSISHDGTRVVLGTPRDGTVGKVQIFEAQAAVAPAAPP